MILEGVEMPVWWYWDASWCCGAGRYFSTEASEVGGKHSLTCDDQSIKEIFFILQIYTSACKGEADPWCWGKPPTEGKGDILCLLYLS